MRFARSSAGMSEPPWRSHSGAAMAMPPAAVVAGASEGIGAAFARDVVLRGAGLRAVFFFDRDVARRRVLVAGISRR